MTTHLYSTQLGGRARARAAPHGGVPVAPLVAKVKIGEAGLDPRRAASALELDRDEVLVREAVVVLGVVLCGSQKNG